VPMPVCGRRDSGRTLRRSEGQYRSSAGTPEPGTAATWDFERYPRLGEATSGARHRRATCPCASGCGSRGRDHRDRRLPARRVRRLRLGIARCSRAPAIRLGCCSGQSRDVDHPPHRRPVVLRRRRLRRRGDVLRLAPASPSTGHITDAGPCPSRADPAHLPLSGRILPTAATHWWPEVGLVAGAPPSSGLNFDAPPIREPPRIMSRLGGRESTPRPTKQTATTTATTTIIGCGGYHPVVPISVGGRHDRLRRPGRSGTGICGLGGHGSLAELPANKISAGSHFCMCRTPIDQPVRQGGSLFAPPSISATPPSLRWGWAVNRQALTTRLLTAWSCHAWRRSSHRGASASTRAGTQQSMPNPTTVSSRTTPLPNPIG